MASSIRRNELEHRSKRESAIARAVSCAATASRRSTPSCRCGDKHIREIMKKRKLTNNGDPFASLEQDVERRCQALQEQAEELVRQVQDNFRCAILKVPRAVQAMALTEFDKIGDGAKNDRLRAESGLLEDPLVLPPIRLFTRPRCWLGTAAAMYDCREIWKKEAPTPTRSRASHA